MDWIRSRFQALRARKPERALAMVPQGEVVYAIGDMHGRADLLRALLGKIKADAAAFPKLKVRLVTLGDYVDRGQDSRGVLDLLTGLGPRDDLQLTALKGNHEEAMLEFLDDPEGGLAWADHGGRETLASYGVRPPLSRNDLPAWRAAHAAFAEALPATHLAFLRDLRLHATIGDYIFVHAGLRPGMPLEHQDERDLLWIREEFLSAPAWSDQVVVHGHTPTAEPVERPGRIGVDTGAYATGILTALRLEGGERRYLRTGT